MASASSIALLSRLLPCPLPSTHAQPRHALTRAEAADARAYVHAGVVGQL